MSAAFRAAHSVNSAGKFPVLGQVMGQRQHLSFSRVLQAALQLRPLGNMGVAVPAPVQDDLIFHAHRFWRPHILAPSFSGSRRAAILIQDPDFEASSPYTVMISGGSFKSRRNL